jgi:hypothetical protein
MQRFLFGLTATNLVLLAFLLTQGRPVIAQGSASVIRGSALEIVDERGNVRARINIEPETTMPDGRTYPESVVLRMTDPSGRIRVKLGADQEGSGLLLANDTQQPGVHLLAKRTETSLKLLDQDGREQLLKP